MTLGLISPVLKDMGAYIEKSVEKKIEISVSILSAPKFGASLIITRETTAVSDHPVVE